MTTHLFGDYCLDVPEYDPRGLEFLDDLAEEGGVNLRAAAVLRSFGTRHGCNVEGSVHPVRDWTPRETWLGGHGRFAEASESRLILRYTSQAGFFTQRRWVVEILLSTHPRGSVTQESLMLPGDVLYPVGLGAATTSGDGTGWHIVPPLRDPKQVAQLLRRRLPGPCGWKATTAKTKCGISGGTPKSFPGTMRTMSTPLPWMRASPPSPSTGRKLRQSPVIGTTVARTNHHSPEW